MLKFHTPTVNNGNLEIKVENISGARLDGKIVLFIYVRSADQILSKRGAALFHKLTKSVYGSANSTRVFMQL